MEVQNQQQPQLTPIKIHKYLNKNTTSACTMIIYVFYLVIAFLTCLSISALVYTMWLNQFTGIENQSIALLSLCSQNYLNIKYKSITSSISLIYQYLFIVFGSTCSSTSFTIFNTIFSIVNLIRFMCTSQSQKYKNKQQNNRVQNKKQQKQQKQLKELKDQNQKSHNQAQQEKQNSLQLKNKQQPNYLKDNKENKDQNLSQKLQKNKQGTDESQNQFHLVTLNKIVFHCLMNSFSFLLSIIMFGRLLALQIEVIKSPSCSVSYNSSQFATIKVLALIVFTGQAFSYSISIILACLFKHSLKQFELKVKASLKSLKKTQKNANQKISLLDVQNMKKMQNKSHKDYFDNSQRRELLLDKSNIQINDHIQQQIIDSAENNFQSRKYNPHIRSRYQFQQSPFSPKKDRKQLLNIGQQERQLQYRFRQQQKRYITQMTETIEKNRRNQNNIYQYYHNNNINTEKAHSYKSINTPNYIQNQKTSNYRPYSPYQIQKLNQNLYLKNNTGSYSIDQQLYGSLSKKNKSSIHLHPEMGFKTKFGQNYFNKNENSGNLFYKNERLRSNIKYSQNFFDQFESKRVTKQKTKYKYQI